MDREWRRDRARMMASGPCGRGLLYGLLLCRFLLRPVFVDGAFAAAPVAAGGLRWAQQRKHVCGQVRAAYVGKGARVDGQASSGDGVRAGTGGFCR